MTKSKGIKSADGQMRETLVEECDCDCHHPKKGSVSMHCFPCCDGQCRVCGKWWIGLAEHEKTHEVQKSTGYIVELEPGVWHADWSGDPGRTTKKEFAKVYRTESSASLAIKVARRFKSFVSAKIEQIEIPII